MRHKQRSFKGSRGGSFDSAISDVSLLDDDDCYNDLRLTSFSATIGETKPNINSKPASAAPSRGLIINGACFSITALLGIICIFVAFINDPGPEARKNGLEPEDCPENWEMWLYVYGAWIVFLQILSAVSLICQRTSVQSPTTNKQSGCCAKRSMCGRILFIVVQFLQLPLLAWIAWGCWIFFRYPFDCMNDACPGQIFTPSGYYPPAGYNVSSVHVIPPPPTHAAVTRSTTSTTTRLPSNYTSSGQSGEAFAPDWPDACIQEHKFGWVLLVFVVVMTLCSWALTILILVCSVIARRQQQAAAYEAQSNMQLDGIGSLLFNTENIVNKYSPQYSPKRQVSNSEAWRMM